MSNTDTISLDSLVKGITISVDSLINGITISVRYRFTCQLNHDRHQYHDERQVTNEAIFGHLNDKLLSAYKSNLN